MASLLHSVSLSIPPCSTLFLCPSLLAPLCFSVYPSLLRSVSLSISPCSTLFLCLSLLAPLCFSVYPSLLHFVSLSIPPCSTLFLCLSLLAPLCFSVYLSLLHFVSLSIPPCSTLFLCLSLHSIKLLWNVPSFSFFVTPNVTWHYDYQIKGISEHLNTCHVVDYSHVSISLETTRQGPDVLG